MKNLATAAVVALLLLAPGLAQQGQAQKRWTSDQIQELEQKVKFQRNAYQKYETSEREAVEEGMTEQAQRYRDAKNQAMEAYTRLNAEYQKAVGDRREYDRKAQTATDK